MSSPSVFKRKSSQVLCAVHGGDFTFVGPRGELERIEGQMGKKYQFTRGLFLSPGADVDKEGMELNRIVRCCGNRVVYEADARQAEKFVYELGLAGAKSVATLGIKVNMTPLEVDKALPDEKFSLFRSTSARSTY